MIETVRRGEGAASDLRGATLLDTRRKTPGLSSWQTFPFLVTRTEGLNKQAGIVPAHNRWSSVTEGMR